MELKLSAEIREKKEKLDKDQLAAILYGRDQESLSLKMNYNAFDKLFEEAGESNLISLSLGNEAFPVLVKATQKDVIKGTYIHIDLYKVNMKEKVKAEIPLEFVGEDQSKALKELGGVFITNIDEVSVECLPADLVDHIEVDISSLAELGDAIRIEDLKVPAGMHIFQESHEIVCVAEAPKVVEEEKVSETTTEAPVEGSDKSKEVGKEGESKEGDKK
jgi:large subunit ribosomal protein L25